uniref:Anthranilate synthase component 2 n=1 Tax=Polysiphonia scopulorum TaxID=257860 RepID=A0A1Z1MHH9_9FLOR|nr:Anthranilate synthase component II [Polysiphonia scopulorum]ARW65518.1 Anthranilate synthase component II [Polysiphonia scopulorum]
MVIIIDNYDSFTQNLAQYVREIGYTTIIKRNNEVSIDDIKNINPTHIIISPGPGRPENSGICLNVIKEYSSRIPILGICLGHQAIGYVYGESIKKLSKPMHGKISTIITDRKDIFKGIKDTFQASRYHSLVIDNSYNLKNLDITAWTKEGTIMACRHKLYKQLRGIQFHPESLWTTEGKSIIKNFLLP